MNSTDRKHAALLIERIIDIVNAGHDITFKKDFGNVNLTVIVGDTHAHTDPVFTTKEDFINYWYRNLKYPLHSKD